jgi:hypothetical protein
MSDYRCEVILHMSRILGQKAHWYPSHQAGAVVARRSLVAAAASAVIFFSLSPLQASTASASGTSGSPSVVAGTGADPTTVSDVPYSLPVTNLPSATQSPPVAADAPYTPAVLNIIAQLEPDNPPTLAELTNASMMFYGGTNNTCHNVGPVGSPTLTGTATVPSIMAMCWTDAQGVNVTSGPNVAKTTGPMDLMGLGATFDRQIADIWGQTEGTEARELMVTGLFGPQTDIDRMPTWGRNLTTTGADPYLSSQMVAAQINGIQGAGAMSEMKHFAAYNGEDTGNGGAEVQDQALHQIYLTPYEAGFVDGGAAATMCSYQLWQDTSTTLPASVPTLASTYPVSPYGTSSQQTWPLDELHQSCEQPLTLTYALRDLWGSKAMVGSDYGAAFSTAAINQGEDQEMPFPVGFNASNAPGVGGFNIAGTTGDPTGDTCVGSNGNAEPCSTPGATHVAGIPGPGCPKTTGCTLVQAVANGTVPLSVFNQDLATQLYQEQRFGMLGCNQSPVLSICTDPGGLGTDRSGTAPLPSGPTSGATPAADLGTKTGDEAVVERESEEGGVLLKNGGNALPITQSDLNGGVLVTGATAQYLIADPTTEASVGYQDRDAISPLQQLEAFSGDPSAFTYVPALDPVGEPVPSSALSTSNSSVTGNLKLVSTPSGGSTLTSTASSVDYTAVSSQGQLSPGTYTWSGYLYVPTTDTYSLDFQLSSSLPAPASQGITGESWSNGTATLSLTRGTPAGVGSQVVVAGACPAGYDGSQTVTASTSTSVSYALAANPGACSETLAVTGASYTPGFSFGPFSLPGTVTLDFASTTMPPAVGSTITVSGASPPAYNGTFTVTASTDTSVSYSSSTNPGTYASGGSIAVSTTGSALTGAVQVSFNGSPVTLSTPAEINNTGTGVAASPTNAGYTEAGLTNMQYSAGTLTGGAYYPITISFYNTSSGPASLRFGYNRANGDIADAAAAAKGKSMAIVFLDDTGAASEIGTTTSGGTTEEIANPYYNPGQPVSSSNPPYISAIESLPTNQTALVEAVAAANPNTVVVLNTENPVLMPWVSNVKAVLEMWYAGEEGGTSTARLLLGLADPSGHLPITFPANATDTIWAYNETVPLYPGDSTGPHLDRLNGNGGCAQIGSIACPADTATQETEGIYTDYRFFDKEGITPLFPFGWGLSYTNFAYSGLHVFPASDGGLDVAFRVTNTGQVAGTTVPQVYLGAPSAQPAGAQFAVRQLVQFTRVTLQPQQSQQVFLHVTLRQLQYWNSATQQWLLATGDRTVSVGSADSTSAPIGDPTAASALPLQQTVRIPAFDSGPHWAGRGFRAPSITTCDDEQLSATLITGTLVVPGDAWCDVIDTTVAGDVVVDGRSAGVRIAGSTIDGNLLSIAATQAADPLSAGDDVLCNTTVKGNVAIAGSSASVPWLIGLCGGNKISGSITFVGNSATGSTISGNTIAGTLRCAGNGGVVASNNSVGGRTFGQCKVD